MIFEERIQRLIKKIRAEGLDAFLVTDLADLAYLTDIRMEGFWLAASKKSWWVITNRLLDGAFRDAGVKDANLVVQMDFKAALANLAKRDGWSKMAFDGEGTTHALGKYLETQGFASRPDFLGSLRIGKDREELRRLRKSCQITARSMAFIGKRLKPGVTESALALQIERFMREAGAERTSFDLIVGAGPNSAIPHYQTGHRKLRQGDAVVIDIGCVFEKYCSDMTRTFHVGQKPSELFRKVHGIVERSQRAGVDAVKAGMQGKDVDRVCRSLIEKEGYGEAFTHGTGHGVGLEIHEPPWIRRVSENVLFPGHIITVEPGIYLDGKLGVRIEDTVLVTQNGAEVLTKP
jgi:Xaa-Pro aminopeptidase